MIEKEKDSTFLTFKFFLEYLSIHHPTKNIISKRNYIDYMEEGSVDSEKGKISNVKIKYVFDRAVEEGLLAIHGKNYKILKYGE